MDVSKTIVGSKFMCSNDCTTMTCYTQDLKDTVELIKKSDINYKCDTSNPSTSNPSKIDKRKRSAHTEEEWKKIQEKRLSAFKEKQKTKKQKIEDYNNLVIVVERQKLELEEKDAKIKDLEEKMQTSF